MHESTPPNRLAGETSPYLLQHAYNAVEWYPWGKEALDKARHDDLPILLSIGYSACHWCHVMAHESFENPTTAELMNRLFVNIKVDREERPDLDKIYQSSHHILTGRSGGWPLTMFLTPNLVPFFGGTYFPDVPRYGMPSFQEVLRQVEAYYREQRVEIRRQNSQVLKILHSEEATLPGEGLDHTPLDLAHKQLMQSYDRTHGGFGGAPKFPHPTYIDRLLRHWNGTVVNGHPDHETLEVACATLTKMADGGIYDQLGGGFYRYSVDARWMIPHFEKMLYDNGPLLTLYAEAWQITTDTFYRRIVTDTAGWIIREMQALDGSFYSTLDADSEGTEGKFYVWTPEQVQAELDDETYPIFARRFGLDREPNFEHSHWHLYVYHGLRSLSESFAITPAEVVKRMDTARGKLFQVRERRIHPGRDEKVLTAWNGLMIKGMAVAGHLLEEPRYLASAERSLDFIQSRLWRDGRLYAVWKNGLARHPAYLDDYAFLIDAILALLQARWRSSDLQFAVDLAETLLSHYQDQDKGGFYFTADDHEALIHRPKPLADEALPSGNGIAAQVLGRLGHLLGETRYLHAAEHSLQAAWHVISKLPYMHGSLLTALEEYLFPPQIVILRGTDPGLSAWQARLRQRYSPHHYIVAIPADALALPTALAARTPRGEVVAYVCQGMRCSPPYGSLEELQLALAEGDTTPR